MDNLESVNQNNILELAKIKDKNIESVFSDLYEQINTDKINIDDIIKFLEEKMKNDSNPINISSLSTCISNLYKVKQENSNIIIKIVESVKDIMKYLYKKDNNDNKDISNLIEEIKDKVENIDINAK